MIRDAAALLARLRAIHVAIRDRVLATCAGSSPEALAEIVADEGGDLIFAIDRAAEEVIRTEFAELARTWSCVLVGEGLGPTGEIVLPDGTAAERAELRIIIDPIDGTRSLMYQKRPAWVLTGVAANRGPQTSLADVELAVQTEIPLLRQHLCDCLWAGTDIPLGGERYDRLRVQHYPLTPRPSTATTIAHGFGNIVRYFPGARGFSAMIDDELVERVLGPLRPGETALFEDQYPCTGGQFYHLMLGQDRWIADLRPLFRPWLEHRGRAMGHCCHPYDLCTELVARAAGVLVSDVNGQPLAAPLDVHGDVAWVGFANTAIRDQVLPVLQTLLSEHGLLGPGGA